MVASLGIVLLQIFVVAKQDIMVLTVVSLIVALAALMAVLVQALMFANAQVGTSIPVYLSI
jgi:hypothetical protein